MKFEYTEVWGFENALRGMRNPLESYARADSHWCDWSNENDCKICGKYCMGSDENNIYIIGDNDMKLATTLIKAGSEHSKYLRMIHVQCDLVAPRYIWSEFDTYKFVEKNSCSTMHKLLNNKNEITLDMFEINNEDLELFNTIINKLNGFRLEYIQINDNKRKDELLIRAKQILPEGFLQRRTIDTNYAEIRNMINQRKNHRLTEWSVDFISWCHSLPYANKLLFDELEEK